MITLQEAEDRRCNPLDLVEQLVGANEWEFERTSESELIAEIRSRWCDYHMCFLWEEQLGAMFFSCRFDQRVPRDKRPAVHQLLAAINESLWLGHFDLTSEDAMPLFRHTMPLRGVGGASVEQLEDVVDTGLMECERFYPALQMVVWGGQSVDHAVKAAVMDTVGEA